MRAAAEPGQTPYEPRSSERDAARAELGRAPFDLLVVGAASSAPASRARRPALGLRVALVDRSDFGGATSSASSKLIHGGLRYLRLGDVKLVREAHAERRALLRVVAPHLVRRIPFLFPVYRGGPYRPATIQAGLWTYSTLAGDKLGGLVRPERARRSVPALRLEGLRGCGVYQDCVDARRPPLPRERDGRRRSRRDRPQLRRGRRPPHGRRRRVRGAEVRDRLSGDTFAVEARAVVNATGPWLDVLRRLEEPGVAPYGQLSKGVHVTLPLDEPWSSALTIPHDQIRVTFAYPWEGMLLLGTTDTPYEGDPADVTATDEDVDTVLAEAAVAVDGAAAATRIVCWPPTQGCACLPLSDGSTVDARRETAILVGRGGMLTVAGGKLTTYRHIALDALERLAARTRARPSSTGDPCLCPARPTRATSLHASRAPGRSSRRSQPISPISTARGRTGSSPSQRNVRDCSSAYTPPRRTSARRWCSPAGRSGRPSTADVLHRRTTLAARGLTGGDIVSRVDGLLGSAVPR